MSKQTELIVEGMTCTNCARSVSRMLEKKGLEDVYVDFVSKEVRYTNTQDIDIEEVKSGIEKLGFQVMGANSPKSFWTISRKMWFSALFAVPLLLGHLLMPLGIDLPWNHNGWLQLAIAAPALIVGFWHFGQSAFYSLKSGVPNMDVLIIIGSFAAFVYSLYGTIIDNHDYLFYETAVTIMTLVFAGNLMEERSVNQTTNALKELGKLKPEMAKRLVLGPDGESFETLPAKDLKRGDILIVNEGDAFATDGEVLQGQGQVNESLLTGEALPQEKVLNNKVLGGSVLVQGNLKVKVTATEQQSLLSHIINMVKLAQSEKPNIERLADKIAAVFVPVVVGIALLTFLGAYFLFDISFQSALLRAIAVLVISCPCAMGLATPTAVVVGVGRVAKQGILLRGGQTLEQFAHIKNIVFDKTGTLTNGIFEISKVHRYQDIDFDPVVLALEQRSSHPMAKAFVAYYKGTQAAVLQDIVETKGQGIQGTDAQGRRWTLGSWRTLKQSDIQTEHAAYLSFDEPDGSQTLVASFELNDQLKPQAQEIIKALQAQGIETILLSGDKQAKVAALATQLGIPQYYGEQLPQEKLAKIADWSANAPTAMVGDGINDAPALAKANIGISLGNASPVAIQSAQIVLLNDKLSSLLDALKISKATLLTIQQNLFWAFAYNVVAIPVAMSGMLNPMWGALFMACSDLIVIGNSVRLRWKKL